MQMKAQASQLRIAGCLSKSTDVMKSMQQLVKMPEIQKTMMEMSKEMMKVNITEEITAFFLISKYPRLTRIGICQHSIFSGWYNGRNDGRHNGKPGA